MPSAVRLPRIDESRPDFGLITRRVNSYDKKQLVYPESLAAQFTQMSEVTGSIEARAQAHLLHAQIALSRNEICRALMEYEKGMQLCPFDFGFQLRERHLLFTISQALAELGSMDAGHAEFGRGYEKLLEFGEVGFDTHLYAVQHYLLSGNLIRARELALCLFRIGPNLSGLRELLHIIASELGDRQLWLQLETSESPSVRTPSAPPLSPGEIFSLMPKLKQIQDLLAQEKAPEANLILDEVLRTRSKFDPVLVEFYYQRAIALDQQGQFHEAFELFCEVLRVRPENIAYARSYRIQFDRLASEALELYFDNPLNRRLSAFYGVCRSHGYAPWWLCEAVSLIEIRDGERSHAAERMRDILAISPNDTDYLKSALAVARALADEGWVRELEARFTRLRLSRSYDFGLFA